MPLSGIRIVIRRLDLRNLKIDISDERRDEIWEGFYFHRKFRWRDYFRLYFPEQKVSSGIKSPLKYCAQNFPLRLEILWNPRKTNLRKPFYQSLEEKSPTFGRKMQREIESLKMSLSAQEEVTRMKLNDQRTKTAKKTLARLYRQSRICKALYSTFSDVQRRRTNGNNRLRNERHASPIAATESFESARNFNTDRKWNPLELVKARPIGTKSC